MDHPLTAAPRRTVLRGLLGLGAAAVVGTALPAALPSGAASASGRRAARASRGLVLGLASPGLPFDGDAFLRTAATLGYTPTSATSYVAWSTGSDFPADQARALASYGSTPVITWEPWNPSNGVTQPLYRHAAISAGVHDAYLTRWAQQIKAYGGRVVLRLMHEGNGSWYPWGVGVNGNTAASYVAAWRHVVAIFDRVGATNARFRWNPNVDPDPAMPRFETFYPGDAWVDSVSLDGYNWGTTQSWSSWLSFSETFSGPVSRMLKLTAKPLHIDETGCPEGAGGDKAAWVRGMFDYVAARPEIRTVTWFDFAKEADWRVLSSQASIDAFKAGLGTA